jgi:hypothetical protein
MTTKDNTFFIGFIDGKRVNKSYRFYINLARKRERHFHTIPISLHRGEILILVPIAAVAINVSAEPVTLARQPAAFIIVYGAIAIRAVPALIDAISFALQPPVFLRRHAPPLVPYRVAILDRNPVLFRPPAVITTALGTGSYRKQPETKNDGSGRQSQFSE